MKFEIGKVIDLYAAISRAAYIREMRKHLLRLTGSDHFNLHPKWDGGLDEKHRRCPDVWLRIAKFMLRNGLNPVACIEARFREIAKTANRIRPDQIALPSKLELYHKVCQVDEKHLAQQLRTEQQLCCAEIEMSWLFDMHGREAWEYVLLNDNLELSPLFRYCLASSEKLQSVMDRYCQEAVAQYLMSPAGYDSTWTRWLPSDFQESLAAAARAAATSAAVRSEKDG